MALTLLQLLDVTINILSLGGLALGVGLLVDNAIVVAEATGRYRDEGVPVLDAAARAASDVSAPLIAGTLTTVLVFGPIVFVRGLAAALFRDLSLERGGDAARVAGAGADADAGDDGAADGTKA